MRTTGPDVRNTFTFSEKDLPGYKGKSKNKLPNPAERNAQPGSHPGGIDKHGRYQRFTKKAVPSMLAVVGRDSSSSD